MPTPLYYPPLVNALQKSLDAQLDTGTTASMTLNNTTNVQNKPGVVVIDRIDTDGNAKSAALREFVIFQGTSGATLTGLTRAVGGSTDQDHAVGAIVEFIPDITWGQSIITALANLVSPTDISAINTTNIVTPTGSQTLTNKTLTSPAVNTPTITTPTISSPVINTGVSGSAIDTDTALAANSDTLLPSQKAVKAYADAKVLSSKVKLTTYNLATASGDVAITGIGFQPTAIICFANVDGSAGGISMGVADSAKVVDSIGRNTNTFFYVNGGGGACLINLDPATGAASTAIVKTYDSDGFTLTWTRGGANTGTANLIFLCFK